MEMKKKRSIHGLYFFPERLRKRLARIAAHPLSVVEAPSGFGKTTAVREYLGTLNKPETSGHVFWRMIGEENRQSEWEVLCSAMGSVDLERSEELSRLAVPYGGDELLRMRNILKRIKCESESFIVIDNYQFVRERIPEKYMENFYQSLPPNLHLILVTQLVNPVSAGVLRDNNVNCIRKNYLDFTADDITAYYKLCGLHTTKKQADEIYRFTEGWIAAIYLTALEYSEGRGRSPSEDVNRLIDGAVWSKLDEEGQKFLLKLCWFGSFDLELARFMNETGEIDKKILAMLEGNGFVSYRSEERRYYIHSILQEYVRREFDVSGLEFRHGVMRLAAKWHELQHQNFMALKFYNEIDDFRGILQINFATSDFTANASAENKALLLSVLDRRPKDVAAEYLSTLIVFAFALFIYNERDRLTALCREIEDALSSNRRLTEAEKNRLSGEMVFLTAFLAHNDFAKMSDGYRRAYELMGGPTSIINMSGPWTFGSPSVLYMFWRFDAETDTACLENNLHYYGRATKGHGTGADLVMRGELLFNQGNLSDAEITAHKAAYASNENGQLNIRLCALFLLAQIAIAGGDEAGYAKVMEELKERAEFSKFPVHLTMAGLCQGFLGAVTDGAISIPAWLRTGETLSRVRFMTLPYADIIYSKALLMSKEYTRLIGIGDMLLKKSSYYPNALAQIYIGIHLSSAYEAIGKQKEAGEALAKALDLATPGRVYMPFAQNFRAIKPILGQNIQRGIAELAGIWVHGADRIRNSASTELSGREREVAVLVAEGLTNEEIAGRLFVASATVKNTLARAFDKTGTKSRAELAVYLAKKYGLD
jgi:LuxR family maltose regulon positive regulatory protein